MKILKYGSAGASVELLQLALNRAGFGPLEIDGNFGGATQTALREFQKSREIAADGVVGPETTRELMPYYTGFFIHKIKEGDSFFSVAEENRVSPEAVITANPGLKARELIPGSSIVVPLPFPVVPENVSCSSRLVLYCISGLSARYPFIKTGEIGKSVMGKPIWSMTLGQGKKRVLYNASHHANEWITSLVLLRYTEDLAESFISGGSIHGINTAELLGKASICLVPAVNPDGIDLVTGDLHEGEFYELAKRIAADYPQFTFPSGWKANIRGVDLNLQYPAAWTLAKEIKAELGITSPAPADFVGTKALCAPESKAIHDFTLSFKPELTLSYHTQGEVIYWQFLDYEPEMSREIAERFYAVSGYIPEETPYISAFAGYKDWFIQDFMKPGYTIEAGLGTNPLPISQFPEIYRKNIGILTLGAYI